MKTTYPKDPIKTFEIWLIYINNQVYNVKTKHETLSAKRNKNLK